MSRTYAGNIPKLYAIKIAKWFMLTMPIIVLFYQENGLSMQDVLTLKGIYSVAVVILEIPSGYLADVWGRKKSLILGAILGCLGFVVYSFSYGFTGFLAAELILGIGSSFISGSDSAMLYDSLLKMKREKEYLKQESRVMSVGNFAEAIAGIAGGSLALISLRTPFVLQSFIAFIAIPAAFLLLDPNQDSKKSKAGFKHILSIVKFSLWDSAKLRWNIMLSSVIGCATLTLAWFIQPYLKDLDMEVSTIGVIWTLLNLTVGFVALLAHRVEGYLGKIGTSVFIVIGISSGFILTGWFHSLIGVGVLFFFYFVRGIATPVLKDYINRITESDMRATVLSVRNFIIRICFAAIGPFLGWYTDHYSISSALMLAGSIFFVLGGMSVIFMRKVER
ncbi:MULTISPECIES: MFS transporter [Marinifilum]|uniref:Putative MFS family arabinose efflux permease n=1 Tax=Marinifilum flexuosum TaxID=1117708 RepID=A0A419WMQ8_9BACT|nr:MULTISPECIES: MFS transporter [Marinifilum]MCY1633186.1 MFS transporter [Marinifilum sp. D737]RKD96741.1 putative MFS family arabinose efflux permease [Marinifilum flexuosum]